MNVTIMPTYEERLSRETNGRLAVLLIREKRAFYEAKTPYLRSTAAHRLNCIKRELMRRQHPIEAA